MTQPETPSRIRRVLFSYPMRLLLAAVLVVGGAGLAFRLGLTGDDPPRTAPAAAGAPQTAAVAGQISEGVWLVGTDVQPGTYRTSGVADGERYCMWSRHSTARGGPMDNILASDGTRAGQLVVTIEPGDVVFRTGGCAPFVKIG